MILESLVTTVSTTGKLNVAPMGPIFANGSDGFQLRPYETSLTFRNLRDSGCGVMHVTDDVLLMAAAALNLLDRQPETFAAEKINGLVLTNCCRWYEFTAVAVETSGPRKTFDCQVAGSGRCRDFFGFNRAKHAIIEATIAATRIGLLPAGEILTELRRAEILVEKTGGVDERCALTLIKQYVAEHDLSYSGTEKAEH